MFIAIDLFDASNTKYQTRIDRLVAIQQTELAIIYYFKHDVPCGSSIAYQAVVPVKPESVEQLNDHLNMLFDDDAQWMVLPYAKAFVNLKNILSMEITKDSHQHPVYQIAFALPDQSIAELIQIPRSDEFICPYTELAIEFQKIACIMSNPPHILVSHNFIVNAQYHIENISTRTGHNQREYVLVFDVKGQRVIHDITTCS